MTIAPGQHGNPSIYCLPSGAWRADVRVRTRDGRTRIVTAQCQGNRDAAIAAMWDKVRAVLEQGPEHDRPNAPTVREIPAAELAGAERYARTGAAVRPPHELLVTLMAEYDRRGAVEQRVTRLLAECDRIETHVRENVPHLPPNTGAMSVHMIRRFFEEK